MNARQRRFLVASLRSLSVLLAAAYVGRVVVIWYFAAETSAADAGFLSLPLSLLLVSAASAMWLAHFLSLGRDVRVLAVGMSSRPSSREMGESCPSWPTILSWLVTDLDEEESQRVSTHVSACDNCRKRLALMNAVQEMASDRGR